VVTDQLAAEAVKSGGRLLKHARYYCLLLAESHRMRRLFGAMLGEDRRSAFTGQLGSALREILTTIAESRWTSAREQR
jgi:hypothetical protein